MVDSYMVNGLMVDELIQPYTINHKRQSTLLAMKKYILALDQGTTSSRAILFDRTGQITIHCTKRIHPDISATRMG